MWTARLRCLSLWAAHVLGVAGVTISVVGFTSDFWVSPIELGPLLSPWVIVGAFLAVFAAALPGRWALASALVLVMVWPFLSLSLDSHLSGLGMVAAAASLGGALVLGVLPPAATEARISLTRLYGCFAVGTLAGIGTGWGYVRSLPTTDLFANVSPWLLATEAHAYPFFLAALVLTWPARFCGDTYATRMGKWLSGMWGAVRLVLGARELAGAFVGMALWRWLVWCVGLLLLTLYPQGDTREVWEEPGWFLAGLVSGSALALLQPHPRRSLGLLPVAATGLAVLLWLTADALAAGPWAFVALGFWGSLGNVPLVSHCLRELPPASRVPLFALRNVLEFLVVPGFVYASAVLVQHLAGSAVPFPTQLWACAAFASGAAAVAWGCCYREFLEQVLELVILPLYRIRGRGPGLWEMPARGPVLVVANHAAWLDPLWLGKVLPRRLVPMMTSSFYDLPVLSFFMRHVVRAIRVEDTKYRREAPELREAMAALDRGECVVIFPEGRLRRTAEKPLHPFGQGVWHVLKERPATLVVACWIEGGWGSYFSHDNGPPTRNKRFDLCRRIDVAVSEPEPVPPDVLADRRATRRLLMRRCLDARRFVGLEPGILPDLTEEAG